MVKREEKPRQQQYKMPSHKSVMIAERIKQVLRDIGVPECKVAMAATEIRKLYRDIPVPIALSQSMYKISQRVFKLEFEKAFRAVESPQGKSRATDTDVSSDWAKDGKEMTEETCRESKPTGARERTRRNEDLPVDAEISYHRKERKTYQNGDHREECDCGKPRKGRNSRWKYKVDRAYEPAADEENEAQSAKEISYDREKGTYPKESRQHKHSQRRPHKGQRQYKPVWACKPSSERKEFLDQECD